jgi:radical SAM superfamily enzyme YgiQ (UPF0313 family)
MKFLLIKAGNRINNTKFSLYGCITQPPLGLLYLGGILEQNGHKVEIIDYTMEDISKEQLKNSLISSDAVGINIITDYYKPATIISKIIKEIAPDIPLIIGGPHCTFFKERSLKDFPLADISVMGEGEHVFLDLVKHLQGKKKLEDIHGIFYRDNGYIRSGKPIQVINNLDCLPFPAHHLVDKYDYGDFPFGIKLKRKVTAMITSKGCPFNCRFCARYSNIIDKWGFRQRSAENVVKEIQELEGKYRSVWIVDDNFLADNKRSHKIFDMLLENGNNVDLLIKGTRVDQAEHGLYKKMQKANVKYIQYGIESGNQDVLDFYNKKFTLKQARNAISLAREMGFFINASFILGAPIETEQHFKNTINFACSLPLDTASIGPLGYIIQSPLSKEAVEKYYIPNDRFIIFADSNNGLGNFTGQELRMHIYRAFKAFYLRPSYLFKQVYRSMLRNDFGLLINGWKFISSI